MGRKTFQSIGRPLPGRANIVISRSGFSGEGIEVLGTLEAAHSPSLRHCRADRSGQGPVIGGGEIYRQAMEVADELLLTEVDAEIEGDTRVPAGRFARLGKGQPVCSGKGGKGQPCCPFWRLAAAGAINRPD
jgi:dihydrofolate reductase